MVAQYPHFLFRKYISSQSTQDGDGNWVAAAPIWVFHCMCREETNGKGAMIAGSDGKSIVFSSTVYMPKGTSAIKEGTEVQVSNTNVAGESLRIKMPVMKFSDGQLNCRLWL